jgi:hypothetical protein
MTTFKVEETFNDLRQTIVGLGYNVIKEKGISFCRYKRGV